MFPFIRKNLKNEALGSSAGTCFFVKVKDKTYCITCCHCVLGVKGWNEVAKAVKDMPTLADTVKKRPLLKALYSDTATIKHPGHPSFSLEKAHKYQLMDLFNNSEDSLTIAEVNLLYNIESCLISCIFYYMHFLLILIHILDIVSYM